MVKSLECEELWGRTTVCVVGVVWGEGPQGVEGGWRVTVSEKVRISRGGSFSMQR